MAEGFAIGRDGLPPNEFGRTTRIDSCKKLRVYKIQAGFWLPFVIGSG